MSLARGANYSQAGIHTTLNDPFGVRDSVRIIGATAGARQPIYEGDETDDHLKQRSWQPGFTLLNAAIILTVVIVVLSAVYMYRQSRIAQLAIEVNKTNDTINSLIADISDLDLQILLQKEPERIEYEAQVLGMVQRDEAEIYMIHAPNPRPYERKTAISAAGI